MLVSFFSFKKLPCKSSFVCACLHVRRARLRQRSRTRRWEKGWNALCGVCVRDCLKSVEASIQKPASCSCHSCNRVCVAVCAHICERQGAVARRTDVHGWEYQKLWVSLLLCCVCVCVCTSEECWRGVCVGGCGGHVNWGRRCWMSGTFCLRGLQLHIWLSRRGLRAGSKIASLFPSPERGWFFSLRDKIWIFIPCVSCFGSHVFGSAVALGMTGLVWVVIFFMSERRRLVLVGLAVRLLRVFTGSSQSSFKEFGHCSSQ